MSTYIELIKNYIINDISANLKRDRIGISQCPIKPENLSELVLKIQDGTISGKAAKTVFESLWQGEQGLDVDAIIEAKGLKQMSDNSALEKLIDDVLAANAQQVADYRGGKEKAFNALVGQVMKAAQGKANPVQVNAMLKEKLCQPI